MSEANKVQHGGDHYRSDFQHWDLVPRMGLSYFAGCASKYIARHRKKNGREDLEKAAHFIQKWIELIEEGTFLYPPYNVPAGYSLMQVGDTRPSYSDLETFISKNLSLPDMDSEAEILRLVCAPMNLRDLQNAMAQIRKLMSFLYPRSQPVVQQDRPPRVESGAIVGWGNPLQDFYPEGYLGIGGDMGKDMYQCRHCNAHISVPANTHPLSYHNCKNRPMFVYQDSGEPGPSYTNQ